MGESWRGEMRKARLTKEVAKRANIRLGTKPKRDAPGQSFRFYQFFRGNWCSFCSPVIATSIGYIRISRVAVNVVDKRPRLRNSRTPIAGM